MGSNIIIKSVSKISDLDKLVGKCQFDDSFVISPKNKSSNSKRVEYKDLVNMIDLDSRLCAIPKDLNDHVIEIEKEVNVLSMTLANIANEVAKLSNDSNQVATDLKLGKIKIGFTKNGTKFPVSLDSLNKAYVDLEGSGTATLQEIENLRNDYVYPACNVLWSNDVTAMTMWPTDLSSVKQEIYNFKKIDNSIVSNIDIISTYVDSISTELSNTLSLMSVIDKRNAIAHTEFKNLDQQLSNRINELAYSISVQAGFSEIPMLIDDGIDDLSSWFIINNYDSSTIINKNFFYQVKLSSHEVDDEVIFADDKTYTIDGINIENGDTFVLTSIVQVSDIKKTDFIWFLNNRCQLSAISSDLSVVLQKIQDLKGGLVYKGHIKTNIGDYTKVDAYPLSILLAKFYDDNRPAGLPHIVEYNVATGKYELAYSIKINNGSMFIFDVNDDKHSETGIYLTDDSPTVLLSDKDFIIIHKHNAEDVELSDICKNTIDIIETEDKDYVRIPLLSSISSCIMQDVVSLNASVNNLCIEANDISTTLNRNINTVSAFANQISVKTDINELNIRKLTLASNYIGNITFSSRLNNLKIFLADYFILDDNAKYFMQLKFRTYDTNPTKPTVRIGLQLEDRYVYETLFTDWKSESGDQYVMSYSIVDCNTVISIDNKSENIKVFIKLFKVENDTITYDMFGFGSPATVDIKKYAFSDIIGYDIDELSVFLADSNRLVGNAVITLQYALTADIALAYKCTRLESISMNGLAYMNTNCMNNAFTGCTMLSNIEFNSLTTMQDDCFSIGQQCDALSIIRMPNLQYVGNGLRNAFINSQNHALDLWFDASSREKIAVDCTDFDASKQYMMQWHMPIGTILHFSDGNCKVIQNDIIKI